MHAWFHSLDSDSDETSSSELEEGELSSSSDDSTLSSAFGDEEKEVNQSVSLKLLLVQYFYGLLITNCYRLGFKSKLNPRWLRHASD
jgi:hypothetical protein